MFKRIGSFFTNMKIGGKLAAGFGALVFLTLLVGAASYVTNTIQNTALADLRQEQSQTHAGIQIKVDLLAARQQEQSFLLRWRQEGYDAAYNTYITQNQQAVTNILKDVADTRAVLRVDEPLGEVNGLNLIENSAKTYGSGVLAVASMLKDRGFRDSGLEGEFRDAAHQVEAALGVDFTNQAAGVTSSKADPKILVLYLEMRRNEKDYELRGDQQYAQATHDFNAKLGQAIQADSQFTPDQKKTLSTSLKTYIDAFDAVVQKDADVAGQTASLQSTADSIIPQVDNLLTLQAQHEQEAVDSYQAASSASRVVQIALSILAVATGILLALIISRLIVRQVDEISKLFRAVAVGEFSVRAKVFGKDEMGQTADGVNAMLMQLTSLLSEVEAAAKSEVEQIFNTAADGMRLVDTDFNTIRTNDTFLTMVGESPQPRSGNPKCYNEFFSSICQTQQCTLRRIEAGEEAIELEVVKERPDGRKTPCFLIAKPFRGADGNLIGIVEDFRDITVQKEAEEQIRSQNEALTTALEDLQRVAAEVEATATEVTSASGEMHAIAQLMTGQAASSATMAERAAASAGQGDRAVHDTMAAIERIRSNTQETAQRIKRLGEVTQEVGEASRLIKDLADRTTVLALNASIQAAAAGEAGRGFAVVAEEVQRLAERATGATRQIDEMITSIRAEANEAMVSVEQVTREVVEGSSLAQSAGEQMSTLNQLSGELSALIQHITETTAAQTTDSLDRLANLTEGLRTSVAGFGTPEVAFQGGNGRHVDQ